MRWKQNDTSEQATACFKGIASTQIGFHSLRTFICGRCSACSILRQRHGRALVRLGLVDDWNELTNEQRAVWFRENHNAFGEELDANITESLLEEIRTKEVHIRNKHSVYLSSPDIREKYKAQPLVAASILKNAPQIDCSIQGITLYGVPNYSETENSEISELREKKNDRMSPNTE